MSRGPQVYTLDDGHDTRLQVMDIGATWLSCQVRAGDGRMREVLLGHADPAAYLVEPGYLGAVIGRYANRIKDAAFDLEGRRFQLAANEGPNQLHGGPQGFDRRRWHVLESDALHVRMGLVSPDGDQGFPGEVTVSVSYRIDAPGRVVVVFEARTTAACPVNLTSHAYFNLDPKHDDSALDCRGHLIALQASHYLPVDGALIPTGVVAPVDGTAFDLRNGARIGMQAFDHCFVIDPQAVGSTTPAARITSSDGLLSMAISTDYPGLQFYNGAHLGLARGRQGRPYPAHAGFALEPQYLPDSPNRPEWPQPSCILRPGEVLRRRMLLQFDAVTPAARPAAVPQSIANQESAA